MTKELKLSASSLIGDKVVNYDGDNLGDVKEIMLNVTSLYSSFIWRVSWNGR